VRACNARRTKVPRLAAEGEGEGERKSEEGRASNERERNGTERGWRNDGEEAMILVIASPAFYGFPLRHGSLQSRLRLRRGTLVASERGP